VPSKAIEKESLFMISPEELVSEKFRKALLLGATGYTVGPSILTI